MWPPWSHPCTHFELLDMIIELFPLTNTPIVVLLCDVQDGYMVYECNSSCYCQDDCQNRVLQKGVQVKLEVFKSRHKVHGPFFSRASSQALLCAMSNLQHCM